MTSIWIEKLVRLHICVEGDKENKVGDIKISYVDDIDDYCLDRLDNS